MISWKDLYNVLTAVIPLYVAMILAYASVRRWKIFDPDQCSGINRFVAVFAVPLLSFHFISTNDLFAMNLRFIAADTLQKIFMLLALSLWANYFGAMDCLITGFSLSTLPNTLVMGIPLLIAMYGPHSRDLMIQLLVLQCIIWYTLLLFLFEFRAAKALIVDHFPDTAASIVSFRIESDVVSLFDGETDTELGEDGNLRVTIRKSNASRPSNLTGAEIYSLGSSQNPTPRDSNFNNFDTINIAGCQVFPTREPSHPRRPSNFEDTDSYTSRASNPELSTTINSQSKVIQDAKELHMFVWSSSTSPVSDSGLQVFGCDFDQSGRSDRGSAKEIRMLVPDPPHYSRGSKGITDFGGENTGVFDMKDDGRERVFDIKDRGVSGTQMPKVGVMTRLILIMVWRKLIRNPNTYSSLIGLLWSIVSFRWNLEMPIVLEKSISILTDAGLGMAMFSLGLFMALQPNIIACGNFVAAISMAIRFLVGPAVMAAASFAVGLRGTLLRIAIVQAALPQGIVPFVFAKEYNVHAAVLSTAVIFGMLIALPITVVYYFVLGL